MTDMDHFIVSEEYFHSFTTEIKWSVAVHLTPSELLGYKCCLESEHSSHCWALNHTTTAGKGEGAGLTNI